MQECTGLLRKSTMRLVWKYLIGVIIAFVIGIIIAFALNSSSQQRQVRQRLAALQRPVQRVQPLILVRILVVIALPGCLSCDGPRRNKG